jgi:hypothetical protein
MKSVTVLIHDTKFYTFSIQLGPLRKMKKRAENILFGDSWTREKKRSFRRIIN